MGAGAFSTRPPSANKGETMGDKLAITTRFSSFMALVSPRSNPGAFKYITSRSGARTRGGGTVAPAGPKESPRYGVYGPHQDTSSYGPGYCWPAQTTNRR